MLGRGWVLTLVMLVCACGGDDDPMLADASSSIDAPVADAPDGVDASANAADADPNAPDADPSAPDASLAPPGDADPSAPDASFLPDADIGIPCGGDMCDLATEECCITQQSTMCVATGMCSGVTLTCDGPEDCGATETCCATLGGPDMGGQTTCTDTCDGVVLCNNGGDCPAEAANCCPSLIGDGNICSPFQCF